MHILLALSILAFGALLWAAFSIAGVVRRSRRRARRRAAEADHLPAHTSSAATAPAPTLVYRELSTGARPHSVASELSDPALPPAAAAHELTEPELTEPELFQPVLAEPELLPPPSRAPRLAHREVRVPRAVTVSLAEEAAESLPPAPSQPPPPPASAEGPPPRLRSFPTRLGKHAVAAASPAETPKWNPFSNDFGDLTDPAPSRRSRDPRSRNRV